MVNHFWQLQLFAEGGTGDAGGSGEGGAAATTGVGSADAGHQRLRELGVPENKIRKNRAYLPRQQPAVKQESAEPEQNQQVAAAEVTEEPKTEEKQAPARMMMVFHDLVQLKGFHRCLSLQNV